MKDTNEKKEKMLPTKEERFCVSRLIVLSGLIIFVFLANFCLAGIPKMINYQGMLTDNSGAPLTDTVNVTFKIYDNSTGGNKKWEETQNNVAVINGLFNVILGSVTPIDTLSFSQEYWLDITVGAEQMPSRLRFTSVAYSFRTGSHDHIGETWSGAVGWSNALLKLNNSLNGPSVWGVNTGGGNAIRANGSGSSIGVYAESESVSAVIGRSQNSWGMEAHGNDADMNDRLGDLLLGGNCGEIFSIGGDMDLLSDGSVYIDLDDNNDGGAEFRVLNGTDNLVFLVEENGNTYAPGTKSAMVQTANHGQRLLYSMESPGVWFEDFGKASLVNGEATVTFESIFAEAANLQVDYHVFLTPLCQEPTLLFVTAKGAKSFTVRGVTLNGQPIDCSFDYRVVAKRLGYEQVRLEPVAEEAIRKGDIRE
jgi:hypothetical protein